MKIDFHLHTHYSDGRMSPAQLLQAVREARLQHWAVTDHDTLAGYRQLREQLGIVPGVEVTAGLDGREIHILGLGVDPDDAVFERYLADIRDIREQRLRKIIQALGLDGAITLAAMRGGVCDALSRNHLAHALVAAGKARHVNDAFENLIGDAQQAGMDLPPYPHPTDAVLVIRRAGGVAILAHPGMYGTAEAVGKLLDLGLDGLEIKHPNLAPNLAKQLEDLAMARKLLVSCGSDLHYVGPRQAGEWRLTREQAAPLLARLRL
jgi:predicted metal-dependent phosphoesterase TrpH